MVMVAGGTTQYALLWAQPDLRLSVPQGWRTMEPTLYRIFQGQVSDMSQSPTF